MSPDTFDYGLATRREVLGAAHVDAALQGADDFTRPLQELVTGWCWGEVWNRPGLDRATRSLLNLAMLTALNRPHELRLHVRGALRNGASVAQIREVLLQAAVYCGVPAAMDATRVAHEELRAQGALGHAAGPGAAAPDATPDAVPPGAAAGGATARGQG